MTATSAAPASATSMETRQRPWWLTLILGILTFIVGAILLWAPAKTKVETYTLLVAMLGIYWLIWGILEIIGMFMDRSAWGWKLFIGIVSIIAGGYILMYPIAAAVTLPRTFVLVLGIWGLIEGIVLLLMAFRGGGWGAGILGVLGIILGLILMGSYMMVGAGLAFLWVAAIAALVGGVVMVVQAFRQRNV